MKNRIVAGVIVLMAVLLAAPAAVQAQSGSGDGFNYSINAYLWNTITITKYTGTDTVVTIPTYINSLQVISIQGEAFYGCTSLTSVTIPSSVVSIGSEPFLYCTGLTAISVDALNSGYSSVDGVLFNKGRTTLIEYPGGKAGAYTIPNSVTSIGDSAFSCCTGVTNVTIPNSVSSIGDSAFWNCPSLTSVTISNGVISIGPSAFSGCPSLSSITIPGSVTSIGSNAFSGCTRLTAILVDALNSGYSSVDGVLLNKSQTTLIQCPGGKAGAYTIPNSVTNIGNNAFYACASLTSVTIGNSVTTIGSYAFCSCASLTSVTIGNSVTTIGDSAFAETRLTSVTIPNSVTTLASSAFCLCGWLTSATIGNGVTNLGDGTFEDCTDLTNVTIGNGVASIGGFVFCGCPSLTSLTIGNSVTNLADWLFEYCTNLTRIYFKGDAPSLGGPSVFCNANATVYYVAGTTGWGTSFGGRPTVLWNPLIRTGDGSFGVRNNQFGFNITGTTNIPIVVEACTDLASPVWTPLQSLTLTNGSYYFSEPLQPGGSQRYYRIGSQ